jgi:hypothetical protein
MASPTWLPLELVDWALLFSTVTVDVVVCTTVCVEVFIVVEARNPVEAMKSTVSAAKTMVRAL